MTNELFNKLRGRLSISWKYILDTIELCDELKEISNLEPENVPPITVLCYIIEDNIAS